jgi:PST family polysaccharide transporter
LLIVIGFGWLLADAGFGAALVQKQVISDADIGYSIGCILIGGSLVAVAVAAFAVYIAELLGDTRLTSMIRISSLIIFLQALSNVPTSLLRRALKMRRLQIAQLVSYIVGFGGVAVVLAGRGYGAWSLVIAFAVQTALMLVLTYDAIRHPLRPRLFGDAHLRSFGLSVLGTNLVNWIIESVDRAVVGRQWGIAALGAYSVAANLSRAPTSLLVASIQPVALASASEIQTDISRLQRGYLAAISVAACIVVPLFAVIALEAPSVVHLLYGSRWDVAIPLFRAFSVAMPFYVLLSITGPVLWAVGAASWELRAQIVAAALLLGGFAALRSTSLIHAVWLVPVVYAARVIFVYVALSSRIQLLHRLTFRAIAGSLATGAVAVAADFAAAGCAGSDQSTLQVRLGVAAVLCLIAMRFWPGPVIGSEARSLVIRHGQTSRLGRLLCAVAGMRA